MNKLFAAAVIVAGLAVTGSSANAGIFSDAVSGGLRDAARIAHSSKSTAKSTSRGGYDVSNSWLKQMNPDYKNCVTNTMSAVTPSERNRLSSGVTKICANRYGMWR